MGGLSETRQEKDMRNVFPSFEAAGITGLKAGVSAQYLRCPQCSGTRKNKTAKPLLVQHEKQVFNCYHCGHFGRIGDSEAEKAIAHYGGFPVDQAWTRTAKSPYTKKFLDYWQGRGISERTLLLEFVYERKVTWGKKVGEAVMPVKMSVAHFPYYNNYELVNIKRRPIEDDAEPKFLMVPHKTIEINGKEVELKPQLVFGGLDRIPVFDVEAPIPYVIITEGESDKLSWVEVGKQFVITVPNGSQFGAGRDDKTDDMTWAAYMKSEALSLLIKTIRHRIPKEDIEKLPHDQRRGLTGEVIFYLALDSDAAGIALRDKLAYRLGRHRCRVVKYPEGCKDANLTLTEHGADGLLACFDNAKFFPQEVIVKASEVSDRIMAIQEVGYQPGWLSGLITIDRHVSFKRKQFTVITGAPGSGKSTLLNWMMPYYAKRNNLRVGFFTPEMAPVERGYAKLAEALVGKSLDPRHPNQMSKPELARAIRDLDEWAFILNPDMSERVWQTKSSKTGQIMKGGSLETLLEIAAQETRRDGLDWLIIDPWNKLEMEPARGQTMHGLTGHMLRMVDQFVKEYDTHITIVAHPKKLGVNKQGNYYRPSLYDISDSAHWNNMPRAAIVVQRDMKDGDGNWSPSAPTWFHVEKVSFEEVGQVGSFDVYKDWWQGNRFVFSPAALDARNSIGQKGMVDKVRGEVQEDIRESAPIIFEGEVPRNEEIEFVDYIDDSPFDN